MKRRSFLKGSAGAGMAGAVAAPAVAQGLRRLTMVTTWGRGQAGVHDAAQRVARNIEAMSDGKLTVDLKAAGELLSADAAFAAVSSGQVDMYHGADYYFTDRHPAFAFFTAIPFGMTAQELVSWYTQQGGSAFHDELGEIFNLKSFLAGNTGPHGGGWLTREITAPDDLVGLKFRMPGLGGQVLSRLGADVQNIPGSQTYDALASGALDGTEWVGPWLDEMAEFSIVTKSYYPAGFHEPAAGLSLAVNRDLFAGMPPAQQKIVEIAALECHQWSLALFQSNNGAALQRLVDGGVVLRAFPDAVWTAFGEATADLLSELARDDLFGRVLDSVRASMRSGSPWLAASEAAYRAQRDRVLG